MVTFKDRLREAFESGCVFGVKYGLATLIILGSLLLVGKDYFATRQQAQAGQAAFEYLQRVVADQQKQQQKAMPPEVPKDK